MTTLLLSSGYAKRHGEIFFCVKKNSCFLTRCIAVESENDQNDRPNVHLSTATHRDAVQKISPVLIIIIYITIPPLALSNYNIIITHSYMLIY